MAAMPGRQPRITATVGRGGANRRDDVALIQNLINAKLPIPLAPLNPDGICGGKTIFAIETFQRRMGMNRPDGRVDPDGVTFRALAGVGSGNAPVPPAPTPTPSGGQWRPVWPPLPRCAKLLGGTSLNLQKSMRARFLTCTTTGSPARPNRT